MLALPEGILQPDKGKKKWNSGKAELVAARDDVGFLDALSSVARERGCIEEVAAVGFSNGAQMAQRWGCEGNGLDAVVAAAGGLLVPSDRCTDRSVAVLAYSGALDDALDNSPTPHRDLPSIRETCEFWRTHNHCVGAPKRVEIGRTTCESWTGDAPLRLCVTAGMGHGFPKSEDGGVEGATDSWAWLQTVL